LVPVGLARAGHDVRIQLRVGNEVREGLRKGWGSDAEIADRRRFVKRPPQVADGGGEAGCAFGLVPCGDVEEAGNLVWMGLSFFSTTLRQVCRGAAMVNSGCRVAGSATS